jgi:hypothetical protein
VAPKHSDVSLNEIIQVTIKKIKIKKKEKKTEETNKRKERGMHNIYTATPSSACVVAAQLCSIMCQHAPNIPASDCPEVVSILQHNLSNTDAQEN